MDSKTEDVVEFLLVVLILGTVANVFGGYLSLHLNWLTSLIIIIVSSTIFVVLKLDLHKNWTQGGVKSKMKKALGIIALVIITIALGVVVADVLYQLQYPQQATVVSASLEAYLDKTLWVDTTLIDWGEVMAGDIWVSNLTVKNTGDVEVTVYLYVTGLPVGWTETWTANGTDLVPGAQAEGDLELSIPLSAADGAYAWNSIITGETP